MTSAPGEQLDATWAKMLETIHTIMWRDKAKVGAAAAALGVSDSSMSRKLRGETAMTAPELFRLLEFLDLDLTFKPSGENAVEVVRGSLVAGAVRHQGLEPRTRWFRARHLRVVA